jgi:TonB family protein
MKAPSIAFLLLSLSSLQSVPLLAIAADACELRVVVAPTHFPTRSQLRGQRGTVLIDVIVDQRGHATDALLIRSSGYRLLDRAARDSVRKGWRFDISGCASHDLPATRRISIEYRNQHFGTA